LVRAAWAILAVVPAAILTLTGCDGQEGEDMAKQARYETYQPADPSVFADGASARPLVAGTVPRPAARVPGYPYAAGPAAPDVARANDVLPDAASSPQQITPDVLRHGQTSFEIYCAPCHGRLGNGEGMIVQRGMVRPPSFHIDRLRDAPDAHYYNVISNGLGAMFSYSDRLKPRERWAVIAYVRALQAAPQQTAAKLSAHQRQVLTAGGDRPAATTYPARGEGGER
jgi:mono/diheme cytochrome c family protein